MVAFRRFRFILSRIALLILPSSFFAGFSRRVSGLFKKFSLWSFFMVFHGDISRCIPIGAHVLACTVYVLHIWFSKQKSSNSKQRFHWRILRGIFPVKATRKWRHLFIWILLHCNFFVIRYIFWLKIAVRHETLSIKT